VFDSPPFFDLENGNLVVDGSNYSTRGGKLESEGQAGVISGVLMSQKAGITPDGSIVFYAIHVNDVYAYFASGKNTGQLENLTEFPITQEDVDQIVDYAQTTYNVTIEDAESLTMELKSSWIKPAPGLDLSNYITIQADIPKFTKVSDKLWTWDGVSLERNVTLAMVGYHVVGSTANHPEMIWATFEHVDNSPDVSYYYIDEAGNLQERKTFGPDGKPIRKDWLFTDGNVTANASNQMHMELDAREIKAMGDLTISPSSTIRTHPWGNSPDSTYAQNNTDIISLNENIITLLAPGDVRRNYFLVGATWTANGVPGVGNQLPDVRGSKILANATMETYFQYKNCFGCHNGGKLSGLSHIIDDITPLPIP
ncbi:MAG: hypothetical protein HKN76_03795, partial [Saprospiraceae bacterium]|nr:hypothetical protein [Saprospiraceae bacterium]